MFVVTFPERTVDQDVQVSVMHMSLPRSVGNRCSERTLRIRNNPCICTRRVKPVYLFKTLYLVATGFKVTPVATCRPHVTYTKHTNMYVFS